MFRATVIASKLREHLAYYFDLVRKDEVVQILHRGGDIKVLMTQEHYLKLLSRLALYEREPSEKRVPPRSSSDIENAVRVKLQEHDREEELQDDSNQLGKKRARQA